MYPETHHLAGQHKLNTLYAQAERVRATRGLRRRPWLVFRLIRVEVRLPVWTLARP